MPRISGATTEPNRGAKPRKQGGSAPHQGGPDMPRPAQLIATAVLVLSLSALGSTAAYAHDPQPDGGVTTSHATPHAKKHAHKITRKTVHVHTSVRHVRATI